MIYLADFKNGFTEDLKTFDIDWQNRYHWVSDIRSHMDLELANGHNVTNLKLFGFFPEDKTLYLFSGFLHTK